MSPRDIAKADAISAIDGLAERVEVGRRAFVAAWIAGEDLARQEGDRAYSEPLEAMRKAAADFHHALEFIETEILAIRGGIDDLTAERPTQPERVP